MKSYYELKEQLLYEASIRQGLPHITTMDHHQFGNLIKDGKVHLHHVTEKTDGMTHMMGHDEHGFYTQSSGSGSEKMRKPSDFHVRAKRRAAEAGKSYDSTSSDAFAHIHELMQKNKSVRDHLKAQYQKTGQDAKIRGEVFYKPLARKSDTHPGEIKFVGTSYNPKHMGTIGKYVVHSKLPENHHVNTEHLTKHSTESMNFDHDKIDHPSSHIDVSHEHDAFHKLNHSLLRSRMTKTNKAEKESEIEKLQKLKHSVSGKVDYHFKSVGVRPKWGSGSEGIVVHPSEHNPEAPRFKVTSNAFRAYKADPNNKINFKKRNES